MIKYFFNLIFLFSIAAFISCTSTSENTDTYFGGKIINPKSNYVVLYSMEKVIDTLYIGKDNKFLGKLNEPNEGLYYFTHGGENQYIYIEPKDSLMLRLNTWDFDESLVFAGKGAERNNILIDCFLEDEKDNRAFYKFNKLEPKEFKKKVDSLLILKNATYKNYLVNHPEETNGYNNILKIALTYPLYNRMERYPSQYVYHTKSKDFPKTEKSFYSHRSIVSTNKDSLMYYFPYSKFIRNYLYNTTYSLGHPPMTKEYSSEFTVDLLSTIDEKINSIDSKNAFLIQTVVEHFYKKSSCNINKDAFDTFFKLSSNEDDKLRIKKLLEDNKFLHKGKHLKNFIITNPANGSHSIKDIINNKNTFLFFWNPEYISKSYISSRINYFSWKYPNIKYLIVKIDGTKSDRIHNLDIKNQFFIDKNSSVNLFLTSKMPRIILINKDGIVENGYASISSQNIYSQLSKLNIK